MLIFARIVESWNECCNVFLQVHLLKNNTLDPSLTSSYSPYKENINDSRGSADYIADPFSVHAR
jgi:hypothetical protein